MPKNCLEVSIFMNGTRAENKARKVIIITSSYRFSFTFSFDSFCSSILFRERPNLNLSVTQSDEQYEQWREEKESKHNPCFIISLRIHNEINKKTSPCDGVEKSKELLIRSIIYAITFGVYRYLLAFFSFLLDVEEWKMRISGFSVISG